jgi:acyl-[acyl-carrier-protein]-phospholipid O-acyltransferase / long-chain-fatty-acid--[acyl-carrier-protein] ligase
MIPARLFLRNCRATLFHPKVADSSGAELTGGKLLAGSLVMRDLLVRDVLEPDEKTVGVLLPPSVGGVVTNAALVLGRRVGVNLNYTLSSEVVNFCIRESGIRRVLTSRRFLEKRPFELDAEVVCLEDLRDRVTKLQKVTAALKSFVMPISMLERQLGLHEVEEDDLLTIIFTSGSTGAPKGVMLSHKNIGSNIEAVGEILHIKKSDVLLGILPFFHSFGYTVPLWLTLCLKPKTVYHFNPLDARQIGKLSKKHGVTIIISAPTFLRSYLKRCEKADFHDLDLVIVGAEKLPMALAEAFDEKFGVMPSEGYGTTELSPAVALNIPDHRSDDPSIPGTKLGTIGKPLPGVNAKIVDPDTREDLGANREGLLLVSGPNVMLGYLNKPDETSDAIRDGWYNTGDFAKIDDDGFIEITGRQSRFSKIAGEMVPHIRVEAELAQIVEDETSDEATISVAVTSVPDQKKGERLIVLHKPLEKSVDEILKELNESGLPNLWIPSADSFMQVDEIPLLGSGKLDLKTLKATAADAFVPNEDAERT